jgi:hypothetical protein
MLMHMYVAWSHVNPLLISMLEPDSYLFSKQKIKQKKTKN